MEYAESNRERMTEYSNRDAVAAADEIQKIRLKEKDYNLLQYWFSKYRQAEVSDAKNREIGIQSFFGPLDKREEMDVLKLTDLMYENIKQILQKDMIDIYATNLQLTLINFFDMWKNSGFEPDFERFSTFRVAKETTWQEALAEVLYTQTQTETLARVVRENSKRDKMNLEKEIVGSGKVWGSLGYDILHQDYKRRKRRADTLIKYLYEF